MGMMSSLRPTPMSQARDDTPSFDVHDLVGQDGIARIVLDGKVYTLRITRSGKLILTK